MLRLLTIAHFRKVSQGDLRENTLKISLMPYSTQDLNQTNSFSMLGATQTSIRYDISQSFYLNRFRIDW